MTFLCLQRPPPVLDALGRVISESPPDQWEARYDIQSFQLLSSDFFNWVKMCVKNRQLLLNDVKYHTNVFSKFQKL